MKCNNFTSYNEFKSMCTLDKLLYILEHPSRVNSFTGRNRMACFTEALVEAEKVLPEGKEKRALDYITRNPGAILNFGGTDVVGPAIEKAMSIMTRYGYAA